MSLMMLEKTRHGSPALMNSFSNSYSGSMVRKELGVSLRISNSSHLINFTRESSVRALTHVTSKSTREFVELMTLNVETIKNIHFLFTL